MDKREQDLWLIRDLNNFIRGPFKHQEVLSLLRKKQLKNKTELSRANSYWFAVEEKAELGRFFPELGIEAPDDRPTQMTSTLTQADAGGEPDDITQMVTVGARDEGGAAGAQWLSPEMAEEFGEIEGVSVVTDYDLTPPAPGEEPAARRENAEATPAEEVLKRATVKADTLPSELKGFHGSRPKPISNLLRAPERAAGGGNVVQVPVQKSEAPVNILSGEAGLEAAERRRRRLVAAVLAGGAAGLAIAGYFWVAKRPAAPSAAQVASAGRKAGLSAEESLRRSLLLYDLEGAKEALAELESDPGARGRAFLPVAQAVLKKEFLFDSESATASLQTARGLASDARTKGEVENLFAIYNFDKDPDGSLETLRNLVKGGAAESVYKYNLAYAYLRQNKPQEALPVIAAVVASLRDDDPLFADAVFVQGWAQELDPKTRDAAEASFLKAITADMHQAKSRLALAIHRLRRSGLRAAEGDFRAFIDSAPELDPPARILEFRKMSGPEFYNAARAWLRELNLDGPMGSRPSPLVMAVDAMLSCLQNRTGEAGKIIEGALASSGGDVSVLKAMGYHRWKEGRYAEIVEMFRDVTRDKMGFAVPYIMGKALLKLDRRPQAGKMFEFITANAPARSEGWALLGDLLLQDGKKADAQAKLLTAIRKDPYNLVALRALHRLGQREVFSEEVMGNLPF